MKNMSERRYSVFIDNVGSCNDRYCSAYGRKYSIQEKFQRVKSIPLITAVDIVMSPEFIREKEVIKTCLLETGLKVAAIAVDIFADPTFQKGSFSSTDKSIRELALQRAKDAADFCRQVGSEILTIWPGQDGYDYLFQSDYIKQRTLFQDAMKELCDYCPDLTVTLEYKTKEPRTHCFINTVGNTLLMCESTGRRNLGIALDYGHAALGYETPAESVAICKMYGNRLKHIHINDNYRLWDDDMIVGSVHTLEFIEFIYWLRRTAYQGYMTIDQFPYREDGRDSVKESAEWLDFLESFIDHSDPEEIENAISKGDAVISSKLMRSILRGVR